MTVGENAYRLTLVALVCAITAITAQIQFRVGPIPYTMQNTGVILSGLLLPPSYAAGALALYLMLIGLGLPFAAGFTGGPSVILGCYGGYLIGFIISAALMSVLSRSYLKWRRITLVNIGRRDFLALILLSLIAIIPTYILGFLIFTLYAIPGSLLYSWSLKVSSLLGLHLSRIATLLIASVLIFIPQDLFMDHAVAIATARGIAELLRFRGICLD